MSAAQFGPALGAAACEAETAFQALVRMVLRLDAADIETEELSDIVEAVSEIAPELIRLADACGHAAVEEWRRAAA